MLMALLFAQLLSPRPGTDEGLKSPEPENWLMYRGNYASWGYSPLDQIRRENVSRLAPLWTFSTGVGEGHQSPPIVNDGLMYLTTPWHQVLALDARTGDLLWRYERDLPDDLKGLHPANRDAFVVALEAKTGALVGEKPVEDYKLGYYLTLAPLVAKGNVMVGVSGGELGVRGFVQALDASTGETVWKTFTVTAPGEPGPAPWIGDARPGDNLYSSSVIALDASTGALAAHHQYHWNDSWDWDEVAAPLLVDVERSGRSIPALVHPRRNGYLWLLPRG